MIIIMKKNENVGLSGYIDWVPRDVSSNSVAALKLNIILYFNIFPSSLFINFKQNKNN